MRHLSLKPPKLTPNDIENLARRFGGKKDDYIEITDKQKNIHTINKYALLKEINDELMATTSIQKE